MTRPLGTNQSIGKFENKQLIHRLIFGAGEISRSKIAELSGLTEASVSLITTTMLNAGLLEEIPDFAEQMNSVRRGRKRKLLRIAKDYCYFLGCDIGPHRITVCLMDLSGRILRSFEHEQETDTYESIKDQAIDLLADFVAKLTVKEKEKIAGIGLSVPARVDSGRGMILDSRYDWADGSIAEDMGKAFSLPVTLVNNVKARAVEHALYHLDTRADSFLYFYVGSGVACQYVTYDTMGKIILPGDGEIGHAVVERGGRTSPDCEEAGCLEAYAAEPVLLERLRALHVFPESVTSSFTEFSSYLSKDEPLPSEAEAVLREAIDRLALAAGMLYSFISPDLVFFSGKLFAGSKTKEWLAQQIDRSAFRFERRAERLRFSESSGLSGARGAASAALLKQYLRQEISAVDYSAADPDSQEA